MNNKALVLSSCDWSCLDQSQASNSIEPELFLAIRTGVVDVVETWDAERDEAEPKPDQREGKPGKHKALSSHL